MKWWLQKWGLPDLFLIDGGKGQQAAALKARNAAGLTIPMIGLAKREEEIILKSPAAKNFATLKLPERSPMVKLLQRIRDESHRFAISYHSTIKRRRGTASLLDEIPGVGPTTRKKLIRRFGSAKGVMGASTAELQNLLGVQTGQKIANYLKTLR